MQLLVIDDDPDITWGLSKLIARLGHDAISCGNAQSAVEALALASPDLVLLDIELPEIDGYKLAWSPRVFSAAPKMTSPTARIGVRKVLVRMNEKWRQPGPFFRLSPAQGRINHDNIPPATTIAAVLGSGMLYNSNARSFEKSAIGVGPSAGEM